MDKLGFVASEDCSGHPKKVPVVACPKCGLPVILDDDYNFCEGCGADLDRHGNLIQITDLEIGTGTVGR
jgi:predicted amidophosphoribosyltransferase